MDIFNHQIHVQMINQRARKINPTFPRFVFANMELEKPSACSVENTPRDDDLVFSIGTRVGYGEYLTLPSSRCLAKFFMWGQMFDGL
jgi:transcription antitermination factor NusG